MSGITGSCIVCGKFHATGHIGDNAVLLFMENTSLLACPECIPFAPHYEEVKCSQCDDATVRLVFPLNTHRAKLLNEWTCKKCLQVEEFLNFREWVNKRIIGKEAK